MATLIERKDVKKSDMWDLTAIYKDEQQWEQDFKKIKKMTAEASKFSGTLSKSADALKSALDFTLEAYLIGDNLGTYAYLKQAENVAESCSVIRVARFMKLHSEFEAAVSYLTPEILAIDEAVINKFLKEPCLKEYLVYLDKILMYKPHTLSDKEERILSLQGELAQTASNVFNMLNDADMDFGEIDTPEGKVSLTHATFSSFQESPDRNLRKNSYLQLYAEFDSHKNTLAKLYASQVNQDLFDAKIRGFKSAREKALFPDKMPLSVYDSLIDSVHKNLPSLHDYYEYCRTKLGLEDFRQYDKYAPVIANVKMHHTYDEAMVLLSHAFEPLGDEYVSIVTEGLKSRWVDRYENNGKRSGAFSSGTYTSLPYMLMNFREDSIESVFTLAHEAGHSMHSYLSAKNNTFQDSHYTIFEAEVASTFNERLLFDYMMKHEQKKEARAFLLNKEINRFVSTLFRQTMFAEFEHIIHKEAEAGKPTSLELIRSTYGGLLKQYFGKNAVLEDVSDLECMRIPHFYRPFYVYKYSTGLSAAVALSNKVLENPSENRSRYLSFLKSGCSHLPLENLQLAGVDMTKPDVVNDALSSFARVVAELKSLNV